MHGILATLPVKGGNDFNRDFRLGELGHEGFKQFSHSNLGETGFQIIGIFEQ